jgi:hypothetical protein
VSATDRVTLDPDTLAALEEQHDFLRRSLDDLDRERDAGDIDEDDYQALRSEYSARAAAVAGAIAERRDLFHAARPRRRPRRALVAAAGLVAVALAAGVLVAQAAGRREGDEAATGDVRRSPTQEAQACLGSFRAQPVESLRCLDEVLADNPQNPTALTYRGWILYQTGQADLQRRGRESIESAVAAAPDFPDAHAFLAVIAVREDRLDDARAELDALGPSPPPQMEALLAPVREAVEG